eukprot:3932883-Amphidinium_carterae.1
MLEAQLANVQARTQLLTAHRVSREAQSTGSQAAHVAMQGKRVIELHQQIAHPEASSAVAAPGLVNPEDHGTRGPPLAQAPVLESTRVDGSGSPDHGSLGRPVQEAAQWSAPSAPTRDGEQQVQEA